LFAPFHLTGNLFDSSTPHESELLEISLLAIVVEPYEVIQMVIGAGAASVGLVTPADSRTKIVKVTLSEEFLANTHTAFQLTGHAKVSDTASEKNATLTAEFSVNLEYVESVSTISNFFIYVQYVLDSFPFTPPPANCSTKYGPIV
jgi:hypothetical protein